MRYPTEYRGLRPSSTPVLLRGKEGQDKHGEVRGGDLYKPGETFRSLPRKGVVQPGADADFAVIDPAKRVKITPDVLHSNIDYTIYDGIEVEGWNVMTIRRGEVVMEEGQITSPRGSGVYVPGKPVK